MPLSITIYQRPAGERKTTITENIWPSDAEWFTTNEASVSMEDLGFSFAVYADLGYRVEDDIGEEADELMVLSKGRDCYETLAELRKACETRMAGPRPRFQALRTMSLKEAFPS